MRDIKFRAWDNENKCFFEDTNRAYENVIEQLFISPAGDINLRKIDGMYHDSMFPGRFVLQQYTGLQDKNGRKIFEGDIIRWHERVTADYQINFNDGVFCLDGMGSSNLYHHREDLEKWEVIGNIYANPELLS